MVESDSGETDGFAAPPRAPSSEPVRRGAEPPASKPDEGESHPRTGEPTAQVSQAVFAGPLPPPNILQAYEQVEAGLADRIVAMAEDQGRHRRELEWKALEGNQAAQTRGQRSALILGLAGAALAGLLVWKDQFLWGVGLFAGELISLATVFLIGRRKGDKELEEKREEEAVSASGAAEQPELPLGSEEQSSQ